MAKQNPSDMQNTNRQICICYTEDSHSVVDQPIHVVMTDKYTRNYS